MISVIVPVYNVEKYIVKCLESIVNQDRRDFELLLVNDGSKDDSISLAREYLTDKDIDWKVIDKENGGLASARNAGLKQARGEYISFIESDDAVSADFLSGLLAEMDDETDFVFCAFQFVKQQKAPEDDNTEKIIFEKEGLMNAFLKRNIAFVVPSMFFKKSFLLENNLFFDEKIRFSEDQPFIWNVILHSGRSVYLYRKMYGYYLRDDSIMTGSSYEKIIASYREFKEVITKIFSGYPEYDNVRELILPRWELGALYTSARIVDYEQYRKIYEEMDGRSILSRIRGIGEIKAYLLAGVCSISLKLLYKLCRRMDLNG